MAINRSVLNSYKATVLNGIELKSKKNDHGVRETLPQCEMATKMKEKKIRGNKIKSNHMREAINESDHTKQKSA